MIDEVEFIVLSRFMRIVVGAIGFARRLDLLCRAGQANHAGVKVVGEFRQLFGRIAFRVDGDEDWFDRIASVLQQGDRLNVACDIHRADVRAIGVAEIDQSRFVDDLRIGDSRAGLVHQGEGSADLIGTAGNRAGAALCKLIVAAVPAHHP